jgi:hypothetical protein
MGLVLQTAQEAVEHIRSQRHTMVSEAFAAAGGLGAAGDSAAHAREAQEAREYEERQKKRLEGLKQQAAEAGRLAEELAMRDAELEELGAELEVTRSALVQAVYLLAQHVCHAQAPRGAQGGGSAWGPEPSPPQGVDMHSLELPPAVAEGVAHVRPGRGSGPQPFDSDDDVY